MKNFFQHIKNNLKYGLMIFLGVPFLFGGVFANDCLEGEDLMRCITRPAFEKDTMMDMGKNVTTVGSTVLGGGSSLNVNVNIDKDPNTKFIEAGVNAKQSVIVKVTKFLLSIVIAIAVTMILWNGIKYIIETGNGKESKNLVPNLIYIVIGIIMALFSVTIITLMQSISTTLDEELGGTNSKIDKVFQS